MKAKALLHIGKTIDVSLFFCEANGAKILRGDAPYDLQDESREIVLHCVAIRISHL